MDNNTIDIKIIANAKEATQGIKNMTSAMNGLGSSTTSSLNAVTIGFKSIIGAMKTAVNIGKQLGTAIYGFSKKAIEASETLNLFNTVFENVQKNGETTFSELGLKATQFQNKMAEALSVDKYETMKYQSLFNSLAKNMGVDKTTAETMSEGMTQLMYDLASLYNEDDPNTVAEAIKSSVYSGNVRPLKNYGVDVTQNALSGTLQELGISDRSISDMSQAEKQLLRYMTALKQTTVAQKDFAETINSPANQLKILKEQLSLLATAIGSLFTRLFAKVLPIINGIIMAVKEMVKAIASFFGITIEDYKESNGITNINADLEEYGDKTEEGIKKTKELKRQLLGFDQVNNITTPSSSSSGSSSGSSVDDGIDKRLLEAIQSYNNGMEEVSNKANEIRDKILGWLGFTKQTDDKTGEVSFKLTNIKAIYKEVVELVKTSKKLIENIASICSPFFEAINKKFLEPLGKALTTGIIDFLKEMKDKFTALSDWVDKNKDGLEMIVSFLSFIYECSPIANVYEMLLKLHSGLDKIGSFLDKHPLLADTLENIFFVVTLVRDYNPLSLLINGFKNLTENLQKLHDTYEKVKQKISDMFTTFMKSPTGQTMIGHVKDILKWIKDNIQSVIDKMKTLKDKYIDPLIKKGNDAYKKSEAYKFVSSLADNLSKACTKITEFKTKFDEFKKNYKTDLGSKVADAYLKFLGLKAEGGVYSNGSWKPITKYASGGLPSTGQMFVAREAGPELVGKLGNSTAVMNNNQIVASVSAGVAKAVAGVMGNGTGSIEVYVHTDEGTVIDRINKRTRQTGICPIEL